MCSPTCLPKCALISALCPPSSVQLDNRLLVRNTRSRAESVFAHTPSSPLRCLLHFRVSHSRTDTVPYPLPAELWVESPAAERWAPGGCGKGVPVIPIPLTLCAGASEPAVVILSTRHLKLGRTMGGVASHGRWPVPAGVIPIARSGGLTSSPRQTRARAGRARARLLSCLLGPWRSRPVVVPPLFKRPPCTTPATSREGGGEGWRPPDEAGYCVAFHGCCGPYSSGI